MVQMDACPGKKESPCWEVKGTMVFSLLPVIASVTNALRATLKIKNSKLSRLEQVCVFLVVRNGVSVGIFPDFLTRSDGIALVRHNRETSEKRETGLKCQIRSRASTGAWTRAWT